MKKYCSRCRKYHDIGYRCKTQRLSRSKETEARKFRATYKWTKKSLEIRQRDSFLCAVCRDNGIYQFKDLSVHHIIPLEEDAGRGFDDDNLITLCLEHHKEAEAGKIARTYLNRLAMRK